MEIKHAILGASSSGRWMACPGSVAAERGLSDEGSQAAKVGTDVHDLARVCLLNGEVDANSYVGMSCADVFSHPSASGAETVPAIWVENATAYLEYVWEKSTPDCERYVEERLSLEVLRPDMFGTADAILLYPERRQVEVVDLKTGFEVVETKGNPQLKYYALASYYRFSNYALETVTVTIVQPNAAHSDGRIRSITFPATELADFMLELLAAAEATDDPKAPRIAGPHCKYCKAKASCEALRDLATAEFAPVAQPAPAAAPSGIPDDELARRYEALDTVEIYVKAIKAEALARSKAAGAAIPGLKWVRGRGRREWSGDGLKIAAEIEAEVGIDVTERACPSPTQVEKLLGKKIYKAAVDKHVSKKPGGLQLVSASDERAEVTPTADDWKVREFAPIVTD